MNLKNKRVLITAGPTWVPIDKVRVISNIATGQTGIFLANRLSKEGAGVVLVLGPVSPLYINPAVKVINFKFFDELRKIIIKELKHKKYDIVIHSAAVSDYKPARIYAHKVKSGIKTWQLNLIPTEKLIALIKRLNRSLFLVGFKFEWDMDKDELTKKAKALMQRANLDLAVANTIKKNKYYGYIISHRQIYGPIYDKKSLVDKLIKVMVEAGL